MRLLGRSSGNNREETKGRLHNSVIVSLLILGGFGLSSYGCPDKCLCSSQTVKCQNQNLDMIPGPIPVNTKSLFVTGNNISYINQASFPTKLDLLTDLYLSGNDIEFVDEMVFNNLPNLIRLDLSSNKVQTFSDRAFPQNSKLQLLNLSSCFHNHSITDVVLDFLHSGGLSQLTALDLSDNDLVILPEGIFDGFSNLVTLNLRNSSLITISNATLKHPPLRDLDLRDNSLKNLPSTTLEDFSLKPGLQIYLAGNPWRCNCLIDELLMWLRSSSQVVDVHDLTCTYPQALRHRPLLQVEVSELKCSNDLEGVLETSYVFLGLVLALIGVIFLLVLYLNRKGIKRWIYNIRDACRDHMEGYHYRYEINSDPRLANLSINSDV